MFDRVIILIVIASIFRIFYQFKGTVRKYRHTAVNKWYLYGRALKLEKKLDTPLFIVTTL